MADRYLLFYQVQLEVTVDLQEGIVEAATVFDPADPAGVRFDKSGAVAPWTNEGVDAAMSLLSDETVEWPNVRVILTEGGNPEATE